MTCASMATYERAITDCLPSAIDRSNGDPRYLAMHLQDKCDSSSALAPGLRNPLHDALPSTMTILPRKRTFSNYMQCSSTTTSCRPIDYEERTLYSTWNVSFQQVRDQDHVAAELLKLMAYLDNQDLWYDLFSKDISNAPEWWIELRKSRVRFNRAIAILHNYSLLEVNTSIADLTRRDVGSPFTI